MGHITSKNYLFDDYLSLTHQFFRNFLGAILNLPPAKQILVSKQLKSKFLNALIQTKHYTLFDKLYNDGKKINYRHTVDGKRLTVDFLPRKREN